MLKLLNITFILILHYFCANCSVNPKTIPPSAVKGVLDLRTWDFEKNGSTNLDGEWEFYWNEFLDPLKPVLDCPMIQKKQFGKTWPCSEIKFIQVPGLWQSTGHESHGFGTYRLKLLLPETQIDSGSLESVKRLSISSSEIGSASEIFVNGKSVSTNGKTGITEADSLPGYKFGAFTIETYFDSLHSNGKKNHFFTPEINLVIHVSNFHQYKSGLWDRMRIGTSIEMAKRAKQRFVIDLLVFSALFIMGLYHFGFYLNRRKDASAFYFGIFCLLISLRTTAINERIILDAFTLLPFSLLHKLEYIGFYFGSFLYLLFVRSLYPNEFSNKWLLAFSTILIPLSAIVILFPLNVYEKSLPLTQFTVVIAIFYVIKVLATAIRNKRQEAKIFLFGWILFSVAILHDILKSMGRSNSPYYLVSYGFLIFIFFQSAMLLRKFARAFLETERLARALTNFSDKLEQEVIDRTIELEKEQKKAILARKEAEFSNEMTIKLIESPSLDASLELIFDFVLEKFDFDLLGLYFLDEVTQLPTLYKLRGNKIPKTHFDFIKNATGNIQDFGTVFISAAIRKKNTYISKIKIKQIKNEPVRKFVENFNVKSLFYIPIHLRDISLGMFVIFKFNKELKLTSGELNSLSLFSYQFAGVIQKGKLFQEAKNRTIELNKSLKLIQNDLNIAKKIQHSTLFTHPSLLTNPKIVPIYIPMTEVGGDFYDIFKLNDYTYRIFLADATGHGVQAAMITIAIKGIYDHVKNFELDAGAILEIFNDEFVHRYVSLNSLLSAMIIDIDTRNQKLKISVAGHPPSLRLRDGKMDLFKQTGKLIGIRKNNTYETIERNYLPGDRLYLFSDGIFEEFNSEEEEFGEERLYSILTENAFSSIEFSIQAVLTSLDQFLNGGQKQDDITILGIDL